MRHDLGMTLINKSMIFSRWRKIKQTNRFFGEDWIKKTVDSREYIHILIDSRFYFEKEFQELHFPLRSCFLTSKEC